MTDWRSAPGPGDLDPGPARCLGGACPHDHGRLDTCDEPPWDVAPSDEDADRHAALAGVEYDGGGP